MSWGCGGWHRFDSVGSCIETIGRWSWWIRVLRRWCGRLWIWRAIEGRIGITRTDIRGLWIEVLRVIRIIAVLLLHRIRGKLSQPRVTPKEQRAREKSLLSFLSTSMASTFFSWVRSPAARDYFFSEHLSFLSVVASYNNKQVLISGVQYVQSVRHLNNFPQQDPCR